MAWDLNTSTNRVEHHLDTLGDIEVEKLTRDADLNSLLSETNCREIYGAHVYADVPNFADLATVVGDGDEYRRVIQSVHLYEREVARIVEGAQIFDGVRIHFQGAKLHALFFRPIDNTAEIATKAVLLLLVLRHFVRFVFNPEFPKLPNLTLSGGADLGNAIGTKNGQRGDRELLFLGAPANYAAKILTGTSSIRITEALFDALSETLQAVFTELQDARYDITVYELGSVTTAEMEELLESADIVWDREASLKRLRADKLVYSLNRIEYSDAEVLIDIDSLGITNNKRVLAASVFGDVSGFTAHIDQASSDEERKQALRLFHAIRKEMAAVVRKDFNGVRVQFQGDRVQAFFHLPQGDEKSIARRAVQTAIGLQSSMELVIKNILPEAKKLGMAVGVEIGTTLVSKLGAHGHRDRICVGDAVEEAARHQEGSPEGEIAISQSIYTQLEEEVQKLFTYKKDRSLYTAANLTQDKVERARKASLYRQTVHVSAGAVGTSISSQASTGSRSFVPSSSYGR